MADKLHGMLTAYRSVDKSTSIACTLASGHPPCIDCHFAAKVKIEFDTTKHKANMELQIA